MFIEKTQRWRDGKAVFIPPTNCVNTRHLEVAAIDEESAKDFVCRTHYSASYPSARRRFGLFERGRFVGAAIFSHPVNDLTITNVFRCDRASDGLELGRLVLLDDDAVGFNAESWFVARCREILAKEGFVGFVMLSDDVQRTDINGNIKFKGHLGTLYAGAGMSLLGRGTPSKLHLLPDGTSINKRTISKIRNGESGWRYAAEILEGFGATACPEDSAERKLWLGEWLTCLTRPLSHPGCLKFGWSFRKNFRLPSLPYPKIRISDLQQKLIFN